MPLEIMTNVRERSETHDFSKSTKVAGKTEQLVMEALNAIGYKLTRKNDVVVTEIDLTDGVKDYEVKSCYTPYYEDDPKRRVRASQLLSEDHLTIDHINLIRDYADDVIILFAVAYPSVTGIFAIEAGECKKILKRNPHRKYEVSWRTIKDKSIKVAISSKECSEIKILPKHLKKLATLGKEERAKKQAKRQKVRSYAATADAA